MDSGYYKLKHHTTQNWEWEASLTSPEANGFSISTAIKLSQTVSLGNKGHIEMSVSNSQSVLDERKESVFEQDILYWSNAPSRLCCLLISTKLKDLLLSLSLPIHRVYPIRFTNPESVTRPDDYYLLHILGSIESYTNYGLSKYERVDYKTRTKELTEYPEVKSLEDYNELSTRLFNEQRVQVMLHTRVLTEAFDIAWGIPNGLWVNKKVHDLLNMRKDIVGFEFIVLDKPKIEFPPSAHL